MIKPKIWREIPKNAEPMTADELEAYFKNPYIPHTPADLRFNHSMVDLVRKGLVIVYFANGEPLYVARDQIESH